MEYGQCDAGDCPITDVYETIGRYLIGSRCGALVEVNGQVGRERSLRFLSRCSSSSSLPALKWLAIETAWFLPALCRCTC